MNKFLFKNLARRSFSHYHSDKKKLLKPLSYFSKENFSKEKNENFSKEKNLPQVIQQKNPIEINESLINKHKLMYLDQVYYNSMKSFGLFGISSISGSVLLSNLNLELIGPISGTMLYGGLFGYSLHSIYSLMNIESKIVEKEKGVYEELENDLKNSYLKKTMISLGLINSPLILIINDIDPLILPSALIVSLGTSGSLCLLAKNLYDKNINLIRYQAPLVASLWGLVGISFLSILGYSPMSISSQSLLGIGIFSMFTVVDMQIILKSYDEKKLDKYSHTLNMTLNLINLFQKISILLAEQKLKK